MTSPFFKDKNIYESLAVAILTSEKSRRMNTNKAFLKIGNQTFLSNLCNQLKNFKNIYISAQNKDFYSDYGHKVIFDEHFNVGPMEGIYQIIKNSSCYYNFVCSVDMPFLKEELVVYLASQISKEYDCFVFTDEYRVHPTCAIYTKTLLPLIEGLISEKKYCLLEIFDKSKTKYIDFPNDKLNKKMITNINTKKDYNKFCKNTFEI